MNFHVYFEDKKVGENQLPKGVNSSVLATGLKNYLTGKSKNF